MFSKIKKIIKGKKGAVIKKLKILLGARSEDNISRLIEEKLPEELKQEIWKWYVTTPEYLEYVNMMELIETAKEVIKSNITSENQYSHEGYIRKKMIKNWEEKKKRLEKEGIKDIKKERREFFDINKIL